MSFKRVFFKNISTLAIYNYSTQGVEFLATIVLSRLLLPDEYGFVAMISIFASFIRLFSTLGIGAVVVRSNYKYTYHKHLFSLAIWIGIALSIVLSLLSYPIALFFDNMKLVVPTMVVSIKFIFDSFTFIPIAVLNKNLNFNAVGKIKLFGTIGQIVFMILLAWLGFSYWSLIIPLIINPIVQYLFLRRYVHLPFVMYGWRATKRMIYRIRSLMGHLSLNNLVRYWSSNTDKLVIGRFYTESDLGLYNRAFRFIQLNNKLITSIFNSVLFPSLKKLMDEKGNAHKEYLDIIRIITLVNMPLVIILVIFPEELVRILWGKDWTGVAPFLPYVGILMVIRSIISTMSSLYLLYRKERNLFFINLSVSLMNIGLVIVGSLFSTMHIIKFLTLGYLFFAVPVNTFYGFYKAFGFRVRMLLRFWIPTLLLGMALFVSVHFEILPLSVGGLAIYISYMLFELRSSVSGTFRFIRGKLNKNQDS